VGLIALAATEALAGSIVPRGPRSLGGHFLVAHPRLTDPNFEQTVVLVLSHGEQGAIGLVVNRPSDLALSRLLPDVESLRERDDRAYFGGPVAPRTIRLLVRAEDGPPGAFHAFDDVWAADDPALLAELVERGVGEVRVYAGYAGWAAGQLDAELARGDWHVAPARAELVFSPRPATIWGALLPRNPRDWSRRGGTPEAPYSERITTDSIVTFSRGRPLDDPSPSSARNVSIPSSPATSPKIVCLPSSHGVSTKVKKNWLPSVPGPALAIDSRPGRSCATPSSNSPSNW
jgi:putative transcriptional regulator